MRYPDLTKQDQTYIPGYVPGEHGIEPLVVPLDKLDEFNAKVNAAAAEITKKPHMKTATDLIEECFTGNSALSDYTKRDLIMVRLGIVLGISTTLSDLTDSVSRVTAPQDLIDWMRHLLHSIPHPESVASQLPNLPE